MKLSFTKILDFLSKYFKLLSFIFVSIMAVWSYFASFNITLSVPVIFILMWLPFLFFRWFRWLYILKVKRKYKGGEEVYIKGSTEQLFVMGYENYTTSKVVCHKKNGDTLTFHENSLELYKAGDTPPIYFSNSHKRDNRW